MQQKIRLVLSARQWTRIEKFCVGKPEDPGGTGADNRMFIEAVLWIARSLFRAGSARQVLAVSLPKSRSLSGRAGANDASVRPTMWNP